MCLQLALIMLENVHWEFRRSSIGQAGRVAIQNLQIDNQLLTAAQPVILAKALRVHTDSTAQSMPSSAGARLVYTLHSGQNIYLPLACLCVSDSEGVYCVEVRLTDGAAKPNAGPGC